MRNNCIFSLVILSFIITSCSPEKQSKDGLAFIDVTKNYPEREIPLTDIADVTYLHLSTVDDDYLHMGGVVCTTENTNVVVDFDSRSILFFSKDGNPKSHFNRRGQGSEEYTNIFAADVIYDETADEVFVVSRGGGRSTIQVYSSTGIHKRKISLPGKRVEYLIDFDDHSLFFDDPTIQIDIGMALSKGEDLPERDKYVKPFYRISKTTGEIVDCVELPDTHRNMTVHFDDGGVASATYTFTTQCPEGALLWSPGTDTVYLYRSDKSLTPVIYLTPSLISLSPVRQLTWCIDRGQYQFFEIATIRAGIVQRREGSVRDDLIPVKYYMRNKKTGEVAHPKFILPDYKGKEFVLSEWEYADLGNDYTFILSLYELKEAYRADKLSGKLKELVATLNEDEDNNVFMLVNFK